MGKGSLFETRARPGPAGEGSQPGLRLVPLLLFLAVMGGGISIQAGAVEPAAVVEMTNQLTFTPARVTVNVGQTVEWKNSSLLVHTVTADPKVAAKGEDVALPEGTEPFDSGNIEPAGTFRHSFDVPGVYRYFCIPHEGAGMVGEVVVKSADER